MPRIRIKQLDERVATSGLHFGGGRERRKLAPGEIVDIPEGELLDAVWATGKVEYTLDPATRPLDFLNSREAALTSPTFKSRGADDDREIAQAHAAVAARIAEVSDAQSKPTESPAADTQRADAAPMPADESATPPRRNRRAARRAAVQEATSGQEATA